MSRDQIHSTPTRGSPPRDPGAAELSEMETMRIFVNQRLTAVVEDILAVFGRTVARYREQIERQQQQLDGLKSEEGAWIWAAGQDSTRVKEQTEPHCAPSWIKACPDEQLEQLVQTDGAEAAGPLIRCEAEGGEGGEGDGAPATEDSEEDWRPEESAGRRSAQQQDAAALPPQLSCKVCGESFDNRGCVVTHAVLQPRDCSVCGKHLERPEKLKLHLRAHRDTSFHCDVCGQSFTQRGNLRTHMRIHSGERPFGCTVCGKSFGRRATLVRHIRSHTGEKPFSCSYCGRGFVEKGNLTVHLRTHTGERPYCCSACGRRFSQLSCFQKHPCQRKGLSPT